MRLGEEEQLEATQAQSTGEQVVVDGVEEVRTGRGRAGLVLGERTDIGRTRPAEKAKEKEAKAKENTEAKEELEAKEDSRSRTW